MRMVQKYRPGDVFGQLSRKTWTHCVLLPVDCLPRLSLSQTKSQSYEFIASLCQCLHLVDRVVTYSTTACASRGESKSNQVCGKHLAHAAFSNKLIIFYFDPFRVFFFFIIQFEFVYVRVCANWNLSWLIIAGTYIYTVMWNLEFAVTRARTIASAYAHAYICTPLVWFRYASCEWCMIIIDLCWNDFIII